LFSERSLKKVKKEKRILTHAKCIAHQAGMPGGLNNKGDITSQYMYTVSQKNDNDVLRYNFNAHQPILIIFGIDIAE